MKTLEEIKTEIRESLMAPAKAVELAINDYLEAIRINPDSKARQALQATNDILDYYNKDLYNP